MLSPAVKFAASRLRGQGLAGEFIQTQTQPSVPQSLDASETTQGIPAKPMRLWR